MDGEERKAASPPFSPPFSFCGVVIPNVVRDLFILASWWYDYSMSFGVVLQGVNALCYKDMTLSGAGRSLTNNAHAVWREQICW
jgi:hypothetical protein